MRTKPLILGLLAIPMVALSVASADPGNGNFQGPVLSPPWATNAPAGALDDPPQAAFLGLGGNKVAVIGDLPKGGGAGDNDGIEDSAMWQHFDCLFGGFPDPTRWCTINFDEWLLPGGGVEAATVTLSNGGGGDRTMLLLPRAAGGLVNRTLSIQGCRTPTVVEFRLASLGGDAPGLQNTLLIDNVECHCDDGDRTPPDLPVIDRPDLHPDQWPVADQDLVDLGENVVACCAPGAGCELLTHDSCTTAGGIPQESDLCDPTECGAVSVEETTWSMIKSRYR